MMMGTWPTIEDLTFQAYVKARLAQSAERKALNLVVVGSSPTVGDPGRGAYVHYTFIIYNVWMSSIQDV